MILVDQLQFTRNIQTERLSILPSASKPCQTKGFKRRCFKNVAWHASVIPQLSVFQARCVNAHTLPPQCSKKYGEIVRLWGVESIKVSNRVFPFIWLTFKSHRCRHTEKGWGFELLSLAITQSTLLVGSESTFVHQSRRIDMTTLQRFHGLQ